VDQQTFFLRAYVLETFFSGIDVATAVNRWNPTRMRAATTAVVLPFAGPLELSDSDEPVGAQLD
jgi:hypothetical protein